jgi:outer membrane protein assembly factor BamB
MSFENMHMRAVWTQRRMLISKWARQRIHLLALISMLMLIGAAFLTPVMFHAYATSNERFTPAGNWSGYGYEAAHDNFNPAETIITSSSALNLKQKWDHKAGNGVSDQPVAVNGVLYWGSWDGDVHATNISNNARIWTRFIGQTTDSSCNPPRVGVASSPIVTTVGGQLEVLVGGGDANFYALNAANGQILWHTSLGSSPSTFIWDSPAFFNGSIYIGTSSFGDCPLIQSKFYRLDATNGQIQNTFSIVPDGCVGGGLWGSPTIDESAGTIYLATANSGKCSQDEPYTFALVELKAADLSVVDTYQVPASERPGDSDFGSTPTLFTTGSGTAMVGVANKNGKYYAFDRSNIGDGPVWTAQVAQKGDCPQCGSGSISPSAWDGHTLFVGGGNTKIGKNTCKGSVRALDPDDGHAIWQHCMGGGPVLGSVTAAGAIQNTEVVVACQGNTVIVMDASHGKTLAHLTDHKHGSLLYSAATISNGVLFVGNLDGNIYAYSINGQ